MKSNTTRKEQNTMNTKKIIDSLHYNLRKNSRYSGGRTISLILSVFTYLSSAGTGLSITSASDLPVSQLIALLTLITGCFIAYLIYCIPNAIFDAADAAIQQRAERHNDEQYANHQAWLATQNQE